MLPQINKLILRRLDILSKEKMNEEQVSQLCKGLGKVVKYNENSEVFGNTELVLMISDKTEIYIISDRGIFSCYVMKKRFLRKRLVPIGNNKNDFKGNCFNSLSEAIQYLTTNINIK